MPQLQYNCNINCYWNMMVLVSVLNLCYSVSASVSKKEVTIPFSFSSVCSEI